MNCMDDVPLSWRELLAQIFRETEVKGLGRFEPGFVAVTGREADAAKFIGQRAEHLGKIRLLEDTE